MRMNSKWRKEPSYRALRYTTKVAAVGDDVFMMLQEEEPEMFKQLPPRGGGSF